MNNLFLLSTDNICISQKQQTADIYLGPHKTVILAFMSPLVTVHTTAAVRKPNPNVCFQVYCFHPGTLQSQFAGASGKTLCYWE